MQRLHYRYFSLSAGRISRGGNQREGVVEVHYIELDIAQYLYEATPRGTGPDGACSNGCAAHPIDKLIILCIFHHLVPILTEKR